MSNDKTRGFSPSQDCCRLGAPPSGPCATNTTSKLLSWCSSLTSKRTKFLCSGKPVGSGYVPVGQDPVEERTAAKTVPKGHLAAYVGRRSGELRRVFVPVAHLNHPLFRDLLREAEEEFGISHGGGGITIPCEVSEFERVKSRVDATTAGNLGQRSTWKRRIWGRIWRH
ncbi:hypothetical protein BT93_G0985 [Corymbia citriodora subsp. variegata]|nr:hypothetical protein BT93_G0985 [Corymbia citriodora subsp. variegata]